MFEWVHKEKPEEMCVTAGFCPPMSRLALLPTSLNTLATKAFALQDDDQCNTCQLVIIEASSVLSDPVSHTSALHIFSIFLNAILSLHATTTRDSQTDVSEIKLFQKL